MRHRRVRSRVVHCAGRAGDPEGQRVTATRLARAVLLLLRRAVCSECPRRHYGLVSPADAIPKAVEP